MDFFNSSTVDKRTLTLCRMPFTHSIGHFANKATCGDMSPVTSCLHNSLQQDLNWLIQTVASMFPLVRIPGRLLKGSHSDLICINTIRQNVSVLHKVHLIQNPIVAIKSFTISIGWSGMFQGFRDNKAAKVTGKSGFVPPSRSWRFLLVRFLRRQRWMARHEDTQDVGWRLFCFWKICDTNGQLLSIKSCDLMSEI